MMLDWLRWISYALFAASFVGAVVAARYYARARGAQYYHSRERALGGFKRWSLLVVALVFIAILLLVAPQMPFW